MKLPNIPDAVYYFFVRELTHLTAIASSRNPPIRTYDRYCINGADVDRYVYDAEKKQFDRLYHLLQESRSANTHTQDAGTVTYRTDVRTYHRYLAPPFSWVPPQHQAKCFKCTRQAVPIAIALSVILNLYFLFR